MSFPFSVYRNTNDSNETHGTYYENRQSDETLDKKVSKIAKNIAQFIIRSSASNSDESENNRPPKHFNKHILIFASIVIVKIMLFCAYKAAKDNNLEVLDL